MSELFHDGAVCPECEQRTGTPDVPEGLADDHVPDLSMAQCLRCAVCGHEWVEPCYHDVARAWFAHGAYQQHRRDRDELDRVTEERDTARAAAMAMARAGDA